MLDIDTVTVQRQIGHDEGGQCSNAVELRLILWLKKPMRFLSLRAGEKNSYIPILI
jgi:hypothetical protein